MSDLKEISLDDYYDFPVLKIGKVTGTKIDSHEYPKPKIGKIYRSPIVLPKTSRTVNLTTIIGIETKLVPYFEYAYPPEIKRLHIEERKVYVKA